MEDQNNTDKFGEDTRKKTILPPEIKNEEKIREMSFAGKNMD